MFSVEESAPCAQEEVRLPNQQKEIVRLYDELRPPLYAYLSTLGLLASEAEDLIQEGFFRLVRDLAAGNKVRNIRGWLFRVVHNLAMDVYREVGQDDAVDAEGQSRHGKEQVDPGANPEQTYSQQEQLKRVNCAIQNLTSQQRHCLLLRAEDMSNHDIGVILGISTQRAAFLVQRSLVHIADLCE
jgi:RNA polymerase sigma-70 factor (ECF subfamily)